MSLSQILKWRPFLKDIRSRDPQILTPQALTAPGFLGAQGLNALRLGVFAGFMGQKDALGIRTLVQLRWLAILGQAGVVVLIAYAFRFRIRLDLCLAIIMASVWLNLLLMLNARQRSRFKDWESALQLGFDTLQLTLLLGVTGGLDNPFCLMLIAPPTVAAANLPTRHALGVVVFALLATITLFFLALPIPWMAGHDFSLPPLYRFGLLIAVLTGIVFTSGYAWQAALESARMEQALNATRAVLEKEHRLSALGGLAAAAAHELGTPLGTIQVVAKEMMNTIKTSDPLFEDAALLVSQSQRCRDILKSLSQSPDRTDAHFDYMPLQDFLGSVIQPLKQPGKTQHIDIKVFDGQVIEGTGDADGDGIIIRRRPEWIYALSALVENATDFARHDVYVRVHVHPAHVDLIIEDDGPGFAPDILARLGEPYISSRSFDDAPKTKGQSHSGMGLGFFIAKTLCEHTGARVTFGNRPAEGRSGSGAYVKAMWRRDQIEILWADDQKAAR